MEMTTRFPGGLRVDAQFGDFTVSTDQAKANGGDSSAPEPYAYFLSSIATCAGIFVLRFCQARDIPAEQISIKLSNDWNKEKGTPDTIFLEIQVPPEFPEKYLSALIRAVNECSVKKTIVNQPEFKVTTRQG